MGGYDIFQTSYLGDTNFSEIKNVGYPINSTRDDLHISISPVSRRAFLTRSKDTQPVDYDIFEANLPGFNLKATVYRFKVAPSKEVSFDDMEVSLFTEDFSEIIGMYRVNEKGEFIVVLLPGESGIVTVDTPGMTSEEFDVFYKPSDSISEVEQSIQLTPDSP